MDSKNCFSLVLLGQPVLNSILMRQPHEALRQRIIINYNFTGIQELEAVEYIKDEAAEKSTVYLIGILILALKMALYQFFKFKSL